MNITVKPFKGVRVAVPISIPFEVEEEFVLSFAERPKQHISRIQTLEKLCESAPLNNSSIDKEDARKVLAQ